MPSPTLEDRLRVLETLEPASRPANRLHATPPARRWKTGRTVLAGAALVGVLIVGVLVAGSTQRGAAPAASSTADKTAQPAPLDAPIVGTDGRVLKPEAAKRQLAAANAAVEACMLSHGATKQPIQGGGFAYDDPGNKAAAACKAVAVGAESVADSAKTAAANASQIAAQHAYGACILNDPNATPADVKTLATSPKGLACQTLINSVAGDDVVLAAIAAETIQARPLDDDGHFSLIFAGRTTRAQAATALGDTVQADQSGAEEVIVIAFDGAFVPPSTPAGVTPNRAKTLAYIVNSDGLVTDLAVRNVPFVAPDTVIKAGFGTVPIDPKTGSIILSTPG